MVYAKALLLLLNALQGTYSALPFRRPYPPLQKKDVEGSDSPTIAAIFDIQPCLCSLRDA